MSVRSMMRNANEGESSIRAVEVVLSPGLAREFLARNIDGNRRVSKAHVLQLAHTMREGRFVLNGDSIKFGSDGRLLDGQHRCLAVIEADVSVRVLVLRGLDPTSFYTLDQGKRRTASDFIEHPKSTLIASAARYLHHFEACERRGIAYTGIRANHEERPDNSELYDFIASHPSIVETLDRVPAVVAGPYTPSPALFLATVWRQNDAELVADFFTGLATGEELARQSPIHVLREALLADKIRARKMDYRYKMALVIKAFLAEQSGLSVRSLRWRRSGSKAEPFPMIRPLPDPADE